MLNKDVLIMAGRNNSGNPDFIDKFEMAKQSRCFPKPVQYISVLGLGFLWVLDHIRCVYSEAAQRGEECEAAAPCPLCLAWQVLNGPSMNLYALTWGGRTHNHGGPACLQTAAAFSTPDCR